MGAALLPGTFFLFYFGLVTYSLQIRGEKTREEPKECGRTFCTGSGVGNANDKRAGSPGSSGSHQCFWKAPGALFPWPIPSTFFRAAASTLLSPPWLRSPPPPFTGDDLTSSSWERPWPPL